VIAVDWDEGRVKLDLFEGPLDLLLYLIRKNEIDVHDIPIVEVTQQYQAILDHARRHGLLDLEFAGDYFLLAATLIQIKTRMLLPRPAGSEGGEDAEDPRRELVLQLLEYERFREAALMLQERREIAATMLGRPDEAVRELRDGESYLDVDLLALARAFRKVLEDRRLRTPHVFEPSRFTVRDRIRHVLARLEQATDGRLSFVALFEEATVEEAVVTFLALLELVKRGFVRCRQARADADLELLLVPEADRPPAEDALVASEFDEPRPPPDESEGGEVSDGTDIEGDAAPAGAAGGDGDDAVTDGGSSVDVGDGASGRTDEEH
jgi:segregation and condensation protein A